MEHIYGLLTGLSEERKKIFSLVQKKGPVAKSEILEMTGMKLSTLNRFMHPLKDSGLIVESCTGESSGGRRPTLFDINKKDFIILGIDLSRTYTRVVLTNLKMEILFREQFSMDESHTPELTVKKISGILDSALAALKIEKRKLIGAGLGTVGPIDRSKGSMLNPVNFPAKGWMNVPVRRMLEEELGCPVAIDNGANTAVLSEYLFGDGRKFASMAYFGCGVGIRTGAIASGKIIRMVNDSEGSFGHMTIDVDGEQCSCGNFGCIDCYASIPSIMRSFSSFLKKGRTASISKPIDEIGFLDICSAADSGDALASDVISSAAAVFGAGLANYINLLNPGFIILSGPVIKNSKLFYDVSTEIALKKHYLKGENTIVFSRGGCYGDDAISVGAAAMFIEKCLDSECIN